MNGSFLLVSRSRNGSHHFKCSEIGVVALPTLAVHSTKARITRGKRPSTNRVVVDHVGLGI